MHSHAGAFLHRTEKIGVTIVSPFVVLLSLLALPTDSPLPMRDSSALLFEPYQYQGLLPPNNTTDFLPQRAKES